MAIRDFNSRQYSRYRQIRRETGKMAEAQQNEKAVVQQESGPERLIVSTFFRGVAPEELFRYWTEPSLLLQWWPQEAEVDARLGGSYHMAWPSIQRDLRGNFTVFEPDRLALTWAWDHEPELPQRDVDVRFEPVGDIGTQLTVTHGVYEQAERDVEDRQSHLEGWTYFLTRLHDALA